MKNSQNSLSGRNTVRKIKQHAKEAGVLALSITAGALPTAGTAAEAATKHSKSEVNKRTPIALLEKRTEKRINQDKVVAFYDGTLTISPSETPSTGGAPYVPETGGASYSSKAVVIENPLIVYRGNPRDNLDHKRLLGGDFAFGSIGRASSQADVTLYPFDAKEMHFHPSDGGLYRGYPLYSALNYTNFQKLADGGHNFIRVGLETTPQK